MNGKKRTAVSFVYAMLLLVVIIIFFNSSTLIFWQALPQFYSLLHEFYCPKRASVQKFVGQKMAWLYGNIKSQYFSISIWLSYTFIRCTIHSRCLCVCMCMWIQCRNLEDESRKKKHMNEEEIIRTIVYDVFLVTWDISPTRTYYDTFGFHATCVHIFHKYIYFFVGIMLAKWIYRGMQANKLARKQQAVSQCWVFFSALCSKLSEYIHTYTYSDSTSSHYTRAMDQRKKTLTQTNAKETKRTITILYTYTNGMTTPY